MGSRCQIISAETRACCWAPLKLPLTCSLVPSHCNTCGQCHMSGKQSQKATAPNFCLFN